MSKKEQQFLVEVIVAKTSEDSIVSKESTSNKEHQNLVDIIVARTLEDSIVSHFNIIMIHRCKGSEVR
jgi:hypothetical protein